MANISYPDFLLYDLKTKHNVDLTPHQFQLIFNTLTLSDQRIIELYYRDKKSRTQIAETLQVKPAVVYNKIITIRQQIADLGLLFDTDLILIMGRSGSGKTTLETELKNRFNLSPIKSYTTRPKRNETEDNHTFITEDDFHTNPAYSKENQIASTKINGYHYFATKEQIKDAQVYVIDPAGFYTLTAKLSAKRFTLIYLNVNKRELNKRLKKRAESTNETDQRQLERLQAEDSQFTKFEELLADQALPSNVVRLSSRKLLRYLNK